MEYYDFKTLFNEGESLEANLILELGESSICPDISIMIPTYNRPVLLFEALNSALAQDYHGQYEIVIMDNYSEDESMLLVLHNMKKLSIPMNCRVRLYRCVSHSNGWNMGILKSEADFVVMLHDDDLLNSNHLTITSNLAKKNKMIDILCSDSEILIETDVFSYSNKFYSIIKEWIKRIRIGRVFKLRITHFYFENPAPNTGVFFKKDAVLSSGGFNTKYSPIPDYAFFYNFLKNGGSIYYLNEKLSTIRFTLNEGLKKDTNLKVKIKIELIRQDIIKNNFFLRNFDLGYYILNKSLTALELTDKKSGLDNLNIFILRVYTRILSLINFSIRILF